jgi:hypothetical protein
MPIFPIVDLTATDLDMTALSLLATALGMTDGADVADVDPNTVIRAAGARLGEQQPDPRLQGAARALARSLDRGPDDRHDPTDLMWAAAARLDASPIIPGELAADLPYGSLIVRCDERGAPLELMIVRVGEPGYAVRMGTEDTRYRVLYRPVEIAPQPGEAIPGERARRLPEGSIVVPAALTHDEEVPETDAPVHQRHSDGVWHPNTPAGSRYIVLHVGVR